MTHPKPDRSDQRPNFRKTEDHPAIDIGWNEGVLSDGRPYRAECWAEEQVTSLAVFFSAAGIKDLTNADALALLEREGLVTYRAGGFRSAAARMFAAASCATAVQRIRGRERQNPLVGEHGHRRRRGNVR